MRLQVDGRLPTWEDRKVGDPPEGMGGLSCPSLYPRGSCATWQVPGIHSSLAACDLDFRSTLEVGMFWMVRRVSRDQL